MTKHDGAGDELRRIQEWYAAECNGDWEHTYGVKIETLDNPGWLVEIDLVETRWEGLTRELLIQKRDDLDWVQSEIRNAKFTGACGPRNLAELLNVFLDAVTE